MNHFPDFSNLGYHPAKSDRQACKILEVLAQSFRRQSPVFQTLFNASGHLRGERRSSLDSLTTKENA